MQKVDLIEGDITKNLLKFAFPLMIGNLLQQFYNIADTLIVGRYLGEEALAAVGSSYTLMVFLTSILLGLCMGNSAFLAIQYGRKDMERFRAGSFQAFLMIGLITVAMNVSVFAGVDGIIRFMRVPAKITGLMKEYLLWIFTGLAATFLYNYFSNCLRAIGNSVIPLVFLGVSALLNIFLDFMFILIFHWGVGGAAIATVTAQYASGVGIALYYLIKCPGLRIQRRHICLDAGIMKEIASLSILTCLQQSIMNFGILMVQGLVNSFGTVVMAAFAAAVKIDTFAYSPVQDFGNAFSTFVAQNYGAGRNERVQEGMKKAVLSVLAFCLVISLGVFIFAESLMSVFIDSSNREVISVGVGYLRIEGIFYFFIGLLFLFYGFYRAIKHPGISVVLTVISLGTRVALAYLLSAVPRIGVKGIWVSIPIGWVLADITGAFYYKKRKKRKKVS